MKCKFTRQEVRDAIIFLEAQKAAQAKPGCEESEADQEAERAAAQVDEFGDVGDIEFQDDSLSPEPAVPPKAPPAENIEESYAPNTVGAVIKLLERVDPRSVLHIQDTSKSQYFIYGLSQRLDGSRARGETWLSIADGTPDAE